jgi:glycine cleavage system H lipoate-binding protein
LCAFACTVKDTTPEIRAEQYAPVSGKVEEINEVLKDQPRMINKDAEQRGMHTHFRNA